jgi:rsbT antagonist protein RsbS
LDTLRVTPLGEAQVLLEPGEALDPSQPDEHLAELYTRLRDLGAQRLICDLGSLPVIDPVYYHWLDRLAALCRVGGLEMVAVNLRPAAAYALARQLDDAPAFACERSVERARRRPLKRPDRGTTR